MYFLHGKLYINLAWKRTIFIFLELVIEIKELLQSIESGEVKFNKEFLLQNIDLRLNE